MNEGLSQRLARQFRDKIESGEWAVGKRLPTTRALAAELKVSINTIQNAFHQLEAHDLVERRPRLGGFVKAKPTSAMRTDPPREASAIAVCGPYTDASNADDFGHYIIRGCDRELGQTGYHLSMYSFDAEDPEAAHRLVTALDQAPGGVAGVLCFVGPAVIGLTDELDRREIPWLTVNRPHERMMHNFVTFDAFGGSRLIGRCFAHEGIERVAILTDSFVPGRTTAEKYFGFLQGYIEGGMDPRNVDYIDCKSYTEASAYEKLRDHIDRNGVPRGVYASGDFLALGALRLCREMELSVPDQVAIVGSTGLQVAKYAHPSLTVLQIPMTEMGQEAAKLLIQMAKSKIRRVEGRFVPAKLAVRDSFVVSEEFIAHVTDQIASGRQVTSADTVQALASV
jgi:DNA-binding LacI/PurR family transcriptional regulator